MSQTHGVPLNMGEARRRKMLLGNLYGKPQNNPEIQNTADGETQKLIDATVLIFEIFQNSKVGNSKLDSEALKDLASTHFLEEFEALNRIHSDNEGTFDWARLQIFKAAVLLLADTSELTSESASYITEEIHKAGLIMHEVDGMRGLEDRLVWYFLPKRWHRTIDEAFNGIGTWLS
ncbi:MAG: hypothetical protein AAF630_00625 [Cyanobacteria bacterium P01_C01_bin.38]